MFETQLKCRCTGLTHESSPGYLPRSSKFFLTESKPQYAPDRHVDIEHILLEIEVDLDEKKLWGECTQHFKGVAPKTTELKFDAMDLVVSKVVDEKGKILEFEQNDSQVIVKLKQPLTRDKKSKVTLTYSVVEPRAGLYFIAPDKNQPKRPKQLWTQGQDQDNRFWIPCHDSPNEKATSEMIVTVGEKYTAISNGKLVEETHDKKTKKKTYHYSLGTPHASYLITLCVGEFVKTVDGWKNSKGETIPVEYYSIKGREAETKQSFAKTPKMLDFFSEKTGVDYPYEKYAQIVAWDFIYGGMENTSSTTQTEFTLHPKELEEDYSSEPLVAHELAHQWFGDLLTCKEWSHAWLNEGFATYFESLWMGEEHGHDEMTWEIYQNERTYKGEDSGSYRRPIVTNVYISPSDIFDRHLYEKGGRVLHMLKSMVGDEQWWKAIKLYIETNAQKTVETVDLQRAFEATTGDALSWFFDQWVMKAGHPDIAAKMNHDKNKKTVTISIKQKQKEDDLTPVFKFPLKIKVATRVKGKIVEKTHDFFVKNKEESFSFTSEKPEFVSVNAGNVILGNWDLESSQEMLIAQLLHDTDIVGRAFAAKKLSKNHSRASVDALTKALSKEKFWGVQAEIATALGAIGTELAKEALLTHGLKLKHAKARSAAVRALAEFKSEELIPVFEKIAKTDVSVLCQYSANCAIGMIGTPTALKKIFAMQGKRADSWHDNYERGLIYAFSRFIHDPEALAEIVKYTDPKNSMFIRREAVAALAEIARANASMVLDKVIALSRDSDFFVKLTAVHALESLGDARGVPALSRIVQSSVEPRTKRTALLAIKALREGYSAADTVDKLKTQLDQLQSQYRDAISRLEKIEAKKR